MAAIQNNTESWTGHTLTEVEAHIKSRFNSLPYIIEMDYEDMYSGVRGIPSPSSKFYSDIFNARCLGLMVWNEEGADGDFYTFGHVDANNDEIQFYYRYLHEDYIVTRKILINGSGQVLGYWQNENGQTDDIEIGNPEEIPEEPEPEEPEPEPEPEEE